MKETFDLAQFVIYPQILKEKRTYRFNLYALSNTNPFAQLNRQVDWHKTLISKIENESYERYVIRKYAVII